MPSGGEADHVLSRQAPLRAFGAVEYEGIASFCPRGCDPGEEIRQIAAAWSGIHDEAPVSLASGQQTASLCKLLGLSAGDRAAAQVDAERISGQLAVMDGGFSGKALLNLY